MIRVKKQWQLTNEQWDALPYSEQLEKQAEYEVTSEMEAYEEHVAETKRKAKG
jgi:hypothetical protein